MASDKKKNITRRTFVKHVTGTTLCCAYLPLEVLTDSTRTAIQNTEDRKKAEITGTGKVHLAAACGTYCGACPAYLAKHSEDDQIKMKHQKQSLSVPTKAQKGIPPSNWMDGLFCDGCLSGGTLASHCQNCAIRKCAANKQDDSCCTDCEELPCTRITFLINMGHYLHRKEYLPNLRKISEMGVQEWVTYEEERWRCTEYGLPMSWYDEKCVGCREPRSEDLFPLSESQ